ncbi:MAG: putative transmembrane protein [Bacteroidetes bacterium]|nr:MAG: putative transmembrane protein [Bacteroidota bacterium]
MDYQSAAQAFSEGFNTYVDYVKYSFDNPGFRNPLIYLFLVYIATFLLESLLPKKINYPLVGRKGFWTDLLYVVFIDFVIMVIGLAAVTTTVEFFTKKIFAAAGMTLPLVDLHTLLPSTFVRFLLFFIIIDFTQWFAHYLLHRVNFLWQFHKIHHAQETLGFASTRHFHWGEYLVLKPAAWIPFGLLGFSAAEYVLYYIWIAYFLTFFSHCNVNLKFGFLNYIFITPETHFWHHSRNIPAQYGVNYASSLAIWDLIFRTYYLPKDKEPILGIPDNDVPDTFLGQMGYPFKAVFKMKSSPAQNKDAAYQPQQSRQDRRREQKKKGK